MKKWLQSNLNNIIVGSFLIPILLVAFVSISHVTTFYSMANPLSWAIYLSVAVEIAALAALAGISAKFGKFIYIPFGIVTLIQFVGNFFYSYSHIVPISTDFKNWIDTVQWHYEDLIRDPEIDPQAALVLKRKIDASNQERTDLVEFIDAYFLDQYAQVVVSPEATINTESPAWAVDRLSILALKIYHMQQEVDRTDAAAEHIAQCQTKLSVLLTQKQDLTTAIDQLLTDIAQGRKYMKVYKQMKMYNDDELNPVLRVRK